MKLRIWDRILSALMGLIVMLCAAGVLLYCVGVFPLAERLPALAQGWARWIAVAVCALMMLLGLHGVGMLFRRRKDKGFVLQHTEFGDMSISMKALENMVKKCVEAHPELKVSSTKIYRVRSGISVEIRILLMSGVNIPLAVNALQKQIKQYITSCSGVDVHEVRVKVETDIARLAPPADVSISEDTLPLPVEQICQHKEQPQTYAEKKPAVEPVQPTENAEAQAETAAEAVADPEQSAETTDEPAAEETAAPADEQAEAAEPDPSEAESAAEPEQKEEALI